MSSSEDWYEVLEYKDYLYIIKERLDELDLLLYYLCKYVISTIFSLLNQF